MPHVANIDLNDADALIVDDDWTPARMALRRENCRRAADAYDAFNQPEAVEARRQQYRAEAERALAGMRARLDQEIAAARANALNSVVPFADGAAWLEWIGGMEDAHGQ